MNALEKKVKDEIRANNPLDVYRNRIAANDKRILNPELNNGRTLAAERTAIHTALMAEWAERQHKAYGSDRPFAVVAIGGTGRGEMAPRSDTDFALLFEDEIDKGNDFLLKIQDELIHKGNFEKECGYRAGTLPFSLEAIPEIEPIQLNSFIDMRALYDPSGLTVRFRRRIQSTYDPFEHFLQASSLWRKKADLDPESLKGFDIKMDGLRVFLAGIWTLAGKAFVHSSEIYEALGDSLDLEAYHFLMRIRAYVHSQRDTVSAPNATGSHDEDKLVFEDYRNFGNLAGPDSSPAQRLEVANQVRARLLSARRRVQLFTQKVMGHELQRGRVVKPGGSLVYGAGGLRHKEAKHEATVPDKSSAAMQLLIASQHYDLPIDPAEMGETFRDAGTWLVPTPELSQLFFDSHGSLAKSFAFLAKIDGAENRLFPGYSRFEVSVEERVLKEETALRGSFVRQKLLILEEWFQEGKLALAQSLKDPPEMDVNAENAIMVETALLEQEHLAAVKLALKTKRLPLTREDIEARESGRDAPNYELLSGFSELPLAQYYSHGLEDCEFPAETIRVTEFLIENRRAFRIQADSGINDHKSVSKFADLCQDEHLLRTLYVFTCADRAYWESEKVIPERWFNIRELYKVARQRFLPDADPEQYLFELGFRAKELKVLRDLGPSFFGGVYGQYAKSFGAHLTDLALDKTPPGPRVRLVRDRTSLILAIAASDTRGLAASIAGTLWNHGVELKQAHLFTAKHYQIAMNFFHVSAVGETLKHLAKTVEDSVSKNLYIDEDAADLPRVSSDLSMEPRRDNHYRLSARTAGDATALIYTLTYRIYRQLGANVYGLNSHTGKEGSLITIYHDLPEGMSIEEALAILRAE